MDALTYFDLILYDLADNTSLSLIHFDFKDKQIAEEMAEKINSFFADEERYQSEALERELLMKTGGISGQSSN